mmetsp:Transcript_17785/g.36953  ORF Transcript_17785/g.36953 Transcript_17785/m.36953 type:complete len:223 (-) Transcript_17785:1309-1977(-)
MLLNLTGARSMSVPRTLSRFSQLLAALSSLLTTALLIGLSPMLIILSVLFVLIACVMNLAPTSAMSFEERSREVRVSLKESISLMHSAPAQPMEFWERLRDWRVEGLTDKARAKIWAPYAPAKAPVMSRERRPRRFWESTPIVSLESLAWTRPRCWIGGGGGGGVVSTGTRMLSLLGSCLVAASRSMYSMWSRPRNFAILIGLLPAPLGAVGEAFKPSRTLT